jgi:hypothetical protein
MPPDLRGIKKEKNYQMQCSSCESPKSPVVKKTLKSGEKNSLHCSASYTLTFSCTMEIIERVTKVFSILYTNVLYDGDNRENHQGVQHLIH